MADELKTRLGALYQTVQSEYNKVVEGPDTVDANAVANKVIGAMAVAIGVNTSDTTGQLMSSGLYDRTRQSVVQAIEQYKANPDERFLYVDDLQKALLLPFGQLAQAPAVQDQFVKDEKLPGQIDLESMIRQVLKKPATPTP